MRARRRQPRRLNLAPSPLAYCLDSPVPLVCDPGCKFQFDPPRPPRISQYQMSTSSLSASVQAMMRASSARALPYRGTNVSRYAPTSQRPARGPERRAVWWPRDHPSPRLDNKLRLTHTHHIEKKAILERKNQETAKAEDDKDKVDETNETEICDQKLENAEQIVIDEQIPSTSAEADLGKKKRLYSTVLSMSAPGPINLAQVGVRLSQKLMTPGILKLNPKIMLPAARIRPPNVENKFEELEKEALEQYKASDESIDTKFRELEKQAVEQYSTSNSNTSCSSGQSAEKRAPADATAEKKQPAKFHKDKTVDSVVIYSQNFPDLNASRTQIGPNLKNCHTPQRGEKKEQAHRPSKLRNLKNDYQRAGSDTDYEARATIVKGHKPMRWTLHVVPPKKRHLSLCVSDFSSDDEIEDPTRSMSVKDASPCIKNHLTGKMKMSAHGGGDLNPIMRKT